MKRRTFIFLAAGTAAAGCQDKSGQTMTDEEKKRACQEGLAVDVSALKSTDGQPLIVVDESPLVPPPRPENPEALSEDDPLRWYDMEYAGWRCKKVNLPPSPASGAKGKRVMCLRHMDHPYTTAYTRGMQKVADAYGVHLKTLTAGNADVNIQSQQVDQVINERPDLAIIFPVDAKSVVPMLRKLNQAGVPVIASNLIRWMRGCRTSLRGPGRTTGDSSGCSPANSQSGLAAREATRLSSTCRAITLRSVDPKESRLKKLGAELSPRCR